MSFLERMREKPRHVKAQYAFMTALGATMVVGIFWGLSLPARFSDISLNENNVTEEKNNSEIIDLVETTKSQLGNVIDIFDETVSTPPIEQDEPVILEESVQTEETIIKKFGAENIGAPLLDGSVEIQDIKAKPRVILIGTTTKKTNKSVE